MPLVYLLLAMAWGVAGSILAPWWATAPRWLGDFQRAGLAAGLLPLATGLVVLWCMPPPAPAQLVLLSLLLGAMALYAIQGILFMYLRPPNRPVIPGGLRAGWMISSVLTQSVFVGLAAWLLGIEFASRYGAFNIASPLPAAALAGMIGAGSLSAGVLLAGATAGTVEALRTDEMLLHAEIDTSGGAERDQAWAARLRGIAVWLLLALAARLLCMGASLRLATAAGPLGAHHYINISLAPSVTFIMVRVMIGIVLPTLYAGLAAFTLRAGQSGEAARCFLPAMVMIVLTEIVAAALTVGNWGVAF